MSTTLGHKYPLVITGSDGKRISPLISFRELDALQSRPVSITFNQKPFSWHDIDSLPDERVKQSLNKLRLQYVKFVLNELNKVNVCKFEMVGTTNQTYKSDVDVNLICPIDQDAIKSVIRSVLDIFARLEKIHASYFTHATPHHALFDFNIYASEFIFGKDFIKCNGLACLDPITSSDRQKLWAGLRLINYIQENSISVPSYFRNFAKTLREFKASLLVDDKPYLHHITKFFEYAVKRAGRMDTLYERFSQSKIHEFETYRSVGAFLHIVMTKQALHYTFYEDSLLDNFGFCLENVGSKKSEWTNSERERVCKYIYRMCNACSLIHEDAELQKLARITAKINANRKASKSSEVELKTFYALINYDKTGSKVDFVKCLFDVFKRYIKPICDHAR